MLIVLLGAGTLLKQIVFPTLQRTLLPLPTGLVRGVRNFLDVGFPSHLASDVSDFSVFDF
jgi:hypothetical protein